MNFPNFPDSTLCVITQRIVRNNLFSISLFFLSLFYLSSERKPWVIVREKRENRRLNRARRYLIPSFFPLFSPHPTIFDLPSRSHAFTSPCTNRRYNFQVNAFDSAGRLSWSRLARRDPFPRCMYVFPPPIRAGGGGDSETWNSLGGMLRESSGIFT